MAKRLYLLLLLFWAFGNNEAQTLPPQQDSSLNNLVLPSGISTCNVGELGIVQKSGSGSQSIILIAGLGFGNQQMKELVSHFKKDYTVYAVTPAGFAGSPPPLSDSATQYAELTWINGIVTGILNLIEKEKLDKPIIVAHFIIATQVALNLELEHSDKIGKVIIISGSPYRYYAGLKNGQYTDWENENKLTPKKREELVEKYWAPRWFKTVTKKTWDDNMWQPEDYCSNPKVGKKFFDVSAKAPVQIMIHYLLEWMNYDENAQYKTITNPTLILIPGFNNLLTSTNPGDTASCKSVAAKQYLKYFHQQAWQPAIDADNPFLQFKTIENTGIFMWLDYPEKTFQIMDSFLKSISPNNQEKSKSKT